MFSFYPIPTGRAGGSNFLNSLKEILKKESNYSSKWEKADLILLNSHHWLDSIFKIIKLRIKGKKFVIRIDGPLQIYRKTFFSVFEDRIIYSIAKNLCSGVIYQSKWSASRNKDIDRNLGVLPERIIYNASLSESKNIMNKGKEFCLFVSNSSNSLKGLSEFIDLANKSKDIPELSRLKFFIIGNFSSNRKENNLINLGFKQKKDLEIWMMKCKYFIHPSKFEACSNALLEAINFKMIPFVYSSSSNVELVQDKRLQFSSVDELIIKLKLVISNKNFKPKNLMLNDIDSAAQNYLNFFEEILLQNPESNKFSFFKAINILFSYSNYILFKIIFAVIQRLNFK